MEFTEYLKTKKFNDVTIKYHMRCFRRVSKWCGLSGVDINSMAYNDIMMFIKYCNDQGVSRLCINKFICTTRYYYDFLKQCGVTQENPAAGIFVKGTVRKVPANLLDREEMDGLYKV